MYDVEDIREALSDRNVKEVARRTGLTPFIVYGVVTKRTKHPRFDVIKALGDYLFGARESRSE